MKMKRNKYIGITIMIITFVVVFVILAFYTPNVEIRVALLIAVIGLVSPLFVLWAQIEDKKKEEEEFKQLMVKLEEIQQELKKEDKPRGGVAIADVLASGLEYYTEHMNKPNKEKKND